MITRAHIVNFHGIHDLVFDFAENTYIFGVNESCKTSTGQALVWVLGTEEPKAKRRHATAPEVVRQGAKTCEVEVTVNGRVFGRTQGRTGSSKRTVDGIVTALPEFEAAVLSVVGVSPDVIAAAMRSGSLLDREPQALLDMLLAICGGTITPEAIMKALEPIAPAVKRLWPKTALALNGMDQISDLATNAIEVRKQAKRDQERLKGDVSRLPIIDPALLAGCAATDPLTVDDEKTALNARREKAVKAGAQDDGRREERERHLREQIANCEAVPEAKEPAKLDPIIRQNARLEVTRLERQIATDQRQLEVQRTAANGDMLVPETAQLEADAMKAVDRVTASVEKERKAHDAYCRLRDNLKDLKNGSGVCSHCAQPVGAEYLKKLEAETVAAHDEWERTSEALELERAARTTANNRLDAARFATDAARTRVAANAKALALARNIAQEEEDLAAAREKLAAAETAAGAYTNAQIAWERYESAQRGIRQARADLDKLAAPTEAGEPLPPIDARLARIKELEAGYKAIEQAETLRAQIETARQREKDADAVAEACGPGGVQAKLVSGAVKPFLAAAAHDLNRLSEGYTIELVTEDGPRLVARREGVTLGVDALSSGRRRTVLLVLQLTVARLTKAPMVVFDEIELINAEGRKILGQIGQECAREGIQILTLSSNPTPAASPPGVLMYELTAGTDVRTIGVG